MFPGLLLFGVSGSSAVAAANDLVFIATADASNDATITFTGLDSASYDGYLFVLGNLTPAADGTFAIQTSTDGGSSYDSGASDYLFNKSGRDSSDSANAWNTLGDGAADSVDMGHVFPPGGVAGENGVSGLVFLMFPHLAKQTHVQFTLSYIDSNGDLRLVLGNGIRNSAADVDAVQFFFSGTNAESGTITMYGMTNS